ncbi:hypothetical protein RintRC_6395 [Richelia intracellularis]|nr:hypothetical protein RintRC_6395 [Richelia intracellularis]
MKAVLMTVPGNPKVLQLQNVPKPSLVSETELLVKRRCISAG